MIMKSEVKLEISERENTKTNRKYPVYTKSISFSNADGKQICHSLSFNQGEFIFSTLHDMNFLMEKKLLTREIAEAFVKELTWYIMD